MKKNDLSSRFWLIATTAVLLSTGLQILGCSDSEEGQLKPNQPPRVWLSSAPPEGSTEKYTIQLFWGGWDPDGEIAYYEYAITDNENGPFDPADTTGRDKWHKVYGNDSTFMFTADVLADPKTKNMVSVFLRTHTFFIRSVDREGLASIEPAYRSFTARTLSPKVNVRIPPGGSLTPAFVPPITTFQWSAEDYVDDLASILEPDSVSWILESTIPHHNSYDETTNYIRNLPPDSPKWDEWGGWKWYKAPGDSGRFWTTPPLEYGPYVFAIRAMDEAGAVTPVFDLCCNVRRVQVSPRTTGPIFTVRNTYLGAITTAICNEPVTILNLPAGIPVDFCWQASAEHYGGVVSGYRYGWDIEDLTDPDQWEVDYTPFTATQACSPTRTFYFGTHTFTVEVIDNSGYCSRVEVKVNIIQFSMEYNLLLIDDFQEGTQIGWDDPTAPGLYPNDAQHDEFWQDMLSDLDGFAPQDVLPVQLGNEIPLDVIARYKSVIWSAYATVGNPAQSVLHDYVRFIPETATGGGGRRRPNVLALYLAAGGEGLVCGNHPVSQSINPSVTLGSFRFPIIFLYELGGNQTTPPTINTPQIGRNSFAYRELCLETMDFAWVDYIRYRGPSLRGNCTNFHIRTVPEGAKRINTMRGASPLDAAFPTLTELRDEAAGVGRKYNIAVQGLDVEVYNPQYFADLCPTVPRNPRPCFQAIYGLACVNTSNPVYNQPVAFWTSTYADRIAEAPGAIAARSAVFGFPPVYFKPDEIKEAIEAVIFGEWQLPRQ